MAREALRPVVPLSPVARAARRQSAWFYRDRRRPRRRSQPSQAAGRRSQVAHPPRRDRIGRRQHTCRGRIDRCRPRCRATADPYGHNRGRYIVLAASVCRPPTIAPLCRERRAIHQRIVCSAIPRCKRPSPLGHMGGDVHPRIALRDRGIPALRRFTLVNDGNDIPGHAVACATR